jgi:hypothetical protein
MHEIKTLTPIQNQNHLHPRGFGSMATEQAGELFSIGQGGGNIDRQIPLLVARANMRFKVGLQHQLPAEGAGSRPGGGASVAALRLQAAAMAAELVLLQRARFHKSQAAHGAGMFACARVVFVVEFDGIVAAGENVSAQLERRKITLKS